MRHQSCGNMYVCLSSEFTSMPCSVHNIMKTKLRNVLNKAPRLKEKCKRRVNQCNTDREWLIRWGRVTHICVSKLTIIGSDNGLSPGWCQAIIWTSAGILLPVTGPLGTNFSEILIKIHTFSFKKIHLKLSSGKWRPFCLSLNVLIYISRGHYYIGIISFQSR